MLVTLKDRASGEETVLTQKDLDGILEAVCNNATYERKDNILTEYGLTSGLHWYVKRRFNITKEMN